MKNKGNITCRRCFPPSDVAQVLDTGQWRLVNNPMISGGGSPRVLILGFSKGPTQCRIAEKRPGDVAAVLFGGTVMRQNLTSILKSMGLLGETEEISDRISLDEEELAFGSLVRCSLSRLMVDKKSDGRSRYASSGGVIQKAFKEIPHVIENCVAQFLLQFPKGLELVVMLGLSDQYIKSCRELLGSVLDESVEPLNPVSYVIGGRTWVHVAHPSPANVGLRAWLDGDTTSVLGRKREYADDVVLGTIRSRRAT